ncbi:signal peptidase II [Mucilaginibacter sp.]|uniref:signal peptidase II n=1 Tax=Mucilaginibacter sp. TaxID=1882438 RepID=UPI0028433E79|nr:signal peptidase II [Mucilaginibacter sp.]MDR3694375.1 signal peptidase II [Mucilaginibacter sp.]
MKSSRLIRTLLILLVLALNIGCDQLSKSFVRHHLDEYSEYTYLHQHISIRRVENTGAFLSLGDSLSGPMKTILLNVLPLLAVLFGLYYIFAKADLNRVTLVGIIFIVGGGIGNIYDRIMHGSVTDFLHINFVIFQTGIFNVADMSIMAGTFMILLHAWFKKKPEEGVKTDTPTGEQI